MSLRKHLSLAGLGGVLLILAIGLTMRPLGRIVPWFTDPLGAILYALLLARLIRMLAPRLRPGWLALWGFLLCAAIELAQLLQAPWLVALRRTTLGNLVLGTGFDLLDFLYYAMGAGLGWLWDRQNSFPATETSSS